MQMDIIWAASGLQTEKYSDHIGTKLADQKLKWHFIPANSLTFGGLWEAGIKSAKSHFKRVIGICTLLVEIEGILNSRLLCPLTEDPEDCSSLTPAHFLIGRTLTAVPEYNLTHVAENRLSKWQHIQAMLQHYWKRWSKEYLSELQTGTKWRTNYMNIVKIGSLALVKDDKAPVLQWQLGRVTGLHRGSDNVVEVLTHNTNYNEAQDLLRKIEEIHLAVLIAIW
ncbi:hypothetical protein HUJ05_007701 [Dendroctonus ponderosae]|nr:hypothetical protein HUJ05_007701 [Dendroctonus ponderosae]